VNQDHGWMRPALAWLFDHVEPAEIRQLILSETTRADLIERLNAAMALLPEPVTIPGGQTADNLVQGLLALRMKFDRETAFLKLERNLAMRGEGRSG
jgi:hypothetical protein